MTYDDVQKDIERFGQYLQANGKRPIAIVVQVCDDHDNTDSIIGLGNQEQLAYVATAVLAYQHGMKMVPK